MWLVLWGFPGKLGPSNSFSHAHWKVIGSHLGCFILLQQQSVMLAEKRKNSFQIKVSGHKRGLYRSFLPTFHTLLQTFLQVSSLPKGGSICLKTRRGSLCSGLDVLFTLKIYWCLIPLFPPLHQVQRRLPGNPLWPVSAEDGLHPGRPEWVSATCFTPM